MPTSHAILQAVMNATPDAIFVKDLEGRYILVNVAAARFIGRPAADIVGKHDVDVYPEETARAFMEADRHVLSTGEPHTFEGVAVGDGVTQNYLVTKSPYRDAEGHIIGLFGISRDVTHRKRAEEALKHAELEQQ